MEKCFRRWNPGGQLDTMYDIEQIGPSEEGFTVTLVADGLRREDLSQGQMLLIWDHVFSYQVSLETYREDCWIGDRKDGWSFFTSQQSPFLEMARAKSVLLPEETIHFLLVGTDLIADILSDHFPKVQFV